MKPRVKRLVEQLLAETDPNTPLTTPELQPTTSSAIPLATANSSANPDSVLRVLVTHLRECGWDSFEFSRGSWSGKLESKTEEGHIFAEFYHHAGQIWADGTPVVHNGEEEVTLDSVHLQKSTPLGSDMKKFAELVTDEFRCEIPTPDSEDYPHPPSDLERRYERQAQMADDYYDSRTG